MSDFLKGNYKVKKEIKKTDSEEKEETFAEKLRTT